MNTPARSLERLDPRLTYAWSAAFLAPALALGFLAAVLVVPKVEAMSAGAGLGGDALVPFLASRWILANGHYGLLAAAVLFLALELRSHHWPRHRRWAAGAFVFIANGAVLLALTALCVAAVVAAAPGSAR